MMLDSRVPGNPPLHVHGNVLPFVGGASFDGMSAYSDATLSPAACSVDPDTCADGFAVGAKVRFGEASLAANVPQYVMDTGASNNVKGVSLYLQLNRLYFKIATSNAVYQVC